MRSRPRLLSKTRYLNGLQCPRLLWLFFHQPEMIPAPNASIQHLFDEGHRIGELARRLYPDGINIPDNNFSRNLSQTKILLHGRKTLFEPAFLTGGVYSRLDILKPVDDDAWDIIEIKSGTRVKEENLDDVSFQRFCAEQFGLKIRKCWLTYINNQYVKRGEIEPEKLFTTRDITVEAEAAACGLQGRIAEMFKIINSPVCPDIPVGGHCHVPYVCPVSVCRAALPADNIFELYRGGEKCSELYARGITSIRNIPAGFELSRLQQIQKECVISGEPYKDRDAINDFLGQLQYPLHFLDFETINPAIPLYDDTRPFQRIPFQFSLHIQSQPGATPQHFSFLADGENDPRPELLANLKAVFNHSGSTITYSRSFEGSVLRELTRDFPEYESWTEDVCTRLIDLYAPFRDFHYYHPAQKGSTSIKEVLPALTGKGYNRMPVSSGIEASLAFLNLVYGDRKLPEKERLKADLENYCGRDTEGMLWIIDSLREVVK